MTQVKFEAIKKEMIEIIEDMIQDWDIDLDTDITEHTMLLNDIEFTSIDIIQLCVAIEEHYDRKFGFQDLLMENGQYVADLSIMQLAVFVENKL